MKILIIDIDISLIGGVAKVVYNLADAFSEKHEVDVLSVFKKNDLFFEFTKNINVIFLNNKEFVSIDQGLLKKEYRRYKYKNPFLYIYMKLKLKIRIYIQKIYIQKINYKIKKMISSYDMVINNNYFYFSKDMFKKAYSLQVIHGNFEIYSHSFLRKINIFNGLIALSTKQINKWKEFNSKLNVIPNFISLMPIDSSNCIQKNILIIGRLELEDEKGFFRLLDIWKIVQNKKIYQDWTLTIVGEGDNENNIKEKIKENKLENIILKPFTKEIEKEYLNASIYVMTSKREAFPMVLIEASSYALPIIAFDINTGPSDIIENEKSGFLINDGDLDDFANKLCVLMDDENLRKTMGGGAKDIVKTKFSKEVIMQKWEELFIYD